MASTTAKKKTQLRAKQGLKSNRAAANAASPQKSSTAAPPLLRTDHQTLQCTRHPIHRDHDGESYPLRADGHAGRSRPGAPAARRALAASAASWMNSREDARDRPDGFPQGCPRPDAVRADSRRAYVYEPPVTTFVHQPPCCGAALAMKRGPPAARRFTSSGRCPTCSRSAWATSRGPIAAASCRATRPAAFTSNRSTRSAR